MSIILFDLSRFSLVKIASAICVCVLDTLLNLFVVKLLAHAIHSSSIILLIAYQIFALDNVVLDQ